MADQQFKFPEYLSSFVSLLEKLGEQYEFSSETITGENQTASDSLLNEEFKDTLLESLEELKQAFADNQLPLLTSVSEDMYDTITAIERLRRTSNFDRNFYYKKAPAEYAKYAERDQLYRAMLERYEEEHSKVFE